MRLNENAIFVDSNVLIGAAAGNATDKRCLQHLFRISGKHLYTSSLCVAHAVTKLHKQLGFSGSVAMVRSLLAKFRIVSCERADIEAATSVKGSDLEDNFQYVMGTKVKCLYFVTHNRKDYACYLNIVVVRPENAVNAIT